MKEFIDLRNSDKFPDDSNHNFHFRERVIVLEAIILNLFWVSFYKAIPQIRSNLYKIFTSDAMQGNSSYMLRSLT